MSHRRSAARAFAIACCTLATAVVLDAATATAVAAHPTRPVHARSALASRTHASHAHASASHARARALAAHTARAAHTRSARLRHASVRPEAAERVVVPPLPAISLVAGAAPAAVTATPASDALAGRSGKLRARFLVPSAAVAAAVAGTATSVAGLFPYLRRLFGDTASRVAPGVYAAPVADGHPAFAFITMLPFSQKVAGRIGSYNMGFWPGEVSGRGGAAYGNPPGFIEVTSANQATSVSEHFTLGDFLTHDQQDVWPKYLVLHEQLLDKLELVLDDLRAHGYRADRLHVMSGFRTPQYNQTGGDPSGRAELSRHQYGDAADVWVENGGGVMADLNGDGRIDARDAAVLAEAADRVEQAHPELVGGIGIYHGTGAHGPFVHIDTRGKRARWGHD